MQKSGGSQRSGGKDDLSGGERPGTFAEPCSGPFGHYSIPSSIQRYNVDSLMLGIDHHPMFLRQVEVVLVQRVLGVVATADHASAALDAAGPGRALTSEVGIGLLDSFLPEMHSHRGQCERILHSEVRRDGAKHA